VIVALILYLLHQIQGEPSMPKPEPTPNRHPHAQRLFGHDPVAVREFDDLKNAPGACDQIEAALAFVQGSTDRDRTLAALDSLHGALVANCPAMAAKIGGLAAFLRPRPGSLEAAVAAQAPALPPASPIAAAAPAVPVAPPAAAAAPTAAPSVAPQLAPATPDPFAPLAMLPASVRGVVEPALRAVADAPSEADAIEWLRKVAAEARSSEPDAADCLEMIVGTMQSSLAATTKSAFDALPQGDREIVERAISDLSGAPSIEAARAHLSDVADACASSLPEASRLLRSYATTMHAAPTQAAA
jgi:hypothetical protein